MPLGRFLGYLGLRGAIFGEKITPLSAALSAKGQKARGEPKPAKNEDGALLKNHAPLSRFKRYSAQIPCVLGEK